MKETQSFWNQRYLDQTTGWDIGYPNPAFLKFVNKYPKETKILIPGCGRSYEGEALFKLGYTNIYLMDYSEEAKKDYMYRVPNFRSENFLIEDFFNHSDSYDLILEQTFFCAINPSLRTEYIKKMFSLLNQNGQLAGLLFNTIFNSEGPPHGGNVNKYKEQFESVFSKFSFTLNPNSIPERKEREIWFVAEK